MPGYDSAPWFLVVALPAKMLPNQSRRRRASHRAEAWLGVVLELDQDCLRRTGHEIYVQPGLVTEATEASLLGLSP